MNRRNFFKTVTGFVVGACAVSKKAIPSLSGDISRPSTSSPSDDGGSSSSSSSGHPTAENSAEPSNKDYIESAQRGDCRYLNRMERLRIEAAEKATHPLMIIDDGLEEAFCYGGKLVRVFRGYMRERFTMIQLREGKWVNRQLLQNYEFENLQYRHWVCEYMLRSLERKLKQELV